MWATFGGHCFPNAAAFILHAGPGHPCCRCVTLHSSWGLGGVWGAECCGAIINFDGPAGTSILGLQRLPGATFTEGLSQEVYDRAVLDLVFGAAAMQQQAAGGEAVQQQAAGEEGEGDQDEGMKQHQQVATLPRHSGARGAHVRPAITRSTLRGGKAPQDDAYSGCQVVQV